MSHRNTSGFLQAPVYPDVRLKNTGGVWLKGKVKRGWLVGSFDDRWIVSTHSDLPLLWPIL